MTERIEAPSQDRLEAMSTYRERVHALYRDVRSWLAGDERFRFAQSPFTVEDGFGEYQVDRFQIFVGAERIADFRPVAATVLFGAGLIKVWGLVDYASLSYFENSPMFDTGHLLNGIDRPGWYWSDVRFEDVRFIDHRRLFDLFEGISDFDRDCS